MRICTLQPILLRNYHIRAVIGKKNSFIYNLRQMI